RQEPLKGHFQHWAHDRQGRPLLVLVFDRGGWDPKLFRELDRHGVGFITWRKPSCPPVDTTCFSETISVPGDKPDETVVIPVFEQLLAVPGYRSDVYTLQLLPPQRDHPVAIITNADRLFPGRYTQRDLFLALRNRWGQENAFKVGKVRHGIDHHGGLYELADLAAERWVPNPRLKTLRRRRKEVENHLNKVLVQEQQMHERWRNLQKKPSWPRYLSQKRNRQLLQRKQALETTLAQIRAELAATPARLPYTEVRGQDAKIIRLERHAALTSLRLVTHHVRLQLLDLAARHFPDHRERNKFVDTLLHAGGCYQRRGEHDLVTVAAPSTPVYRRAAARLLSDLNHLNPTALDGSGRTLIFQLEGQQDPESQHFTL
ncbi:MAG: hypothetical protein Q8R28_22775, partial [Dehalococcoidia bacterium]|nr:hypothetical protein [Dehalococcoidia bacterium]